MTTPASDRMSRLRAISMVDGPTGTDDPARPGVRLVWSGGPTPREAPLGEVEVLRHGTTLRVRMSGEIDLLLSRVLREALQVVREHDGPVDVDLGSVGFFSAEAADVLVAMHQAQPSGVVALVGTSRAVERTLRACGVPPDALRWRGGGS